jgi:hypothetical protein
VAYDLGDTVTDMWGEVRDSTGALTTATGAALTLYKPDGTEEVLAVTTPSTGVYGADYVPVVPGPYRWWLRTTSPATAKTGSFNVRPVIERSIISLADFKAQANMEFPDDDEELRPYLEAATGVVERYLKKAVVRRSITETHTVRGGPLALNWTPVQSLTTVATTDGTTTWDVSGLTVSSAGIVSPASGSISGEVEVTYVAGMGEVPAEYILAALIIAQHLWETQRGQAGGPFAGGLDMPGAGITSFGFSIPNRAKELLGEPPPMVA